MSVQEIEVSKDIFHDSSGPGAAGFRAMQGGGEGEAPAARLDESDEPTELAAVVPAARAPEIAATNVPGRMVARTSRARFRRYGTLLETRIVPNLCAGGANAKRNAGSLEMGRGTTKSALPHFSLAGARI